MFTHVLGIPRSGEASSRAEKSSSTARDRGLDAVGVGVGPFNLSVAALLHPLPGIRVRFFDRKPEFQWHPGLLFPEAKIQVSYLKDLVTLADPTNSFSFLCFLFHSKRLYRFASSKRTRITRREFNQYFRWVCSRLEVLEFGSTVEEVDLDGKDLAVTVGGRRLRTRNVVLATGLHPRIPPCARPHLGPTVFHVYEYLHHDPDLAGKRVAVIGAGQSGAEVVHHALTRSGRIPERLYWISRRANFQPLDDSPFANELFTPNYSHYFFGLPRETKDRLLQEQKLASDGIDPDLLDEIYARLYELEFLDSQGRPCSLQPESKLVGLTPRGGAWEIEVVSRFPCSTGLPDVSRLEVDFVILATGYEYRPPTYLEPLSHRISGWESGPKVRGDFSLEWDGPETCRLYLQGGVRKHRGIADPNLSLMAWRSAVIVNSLVGSTVYPVETTNSAFDWERKTPAEAAAL